ncbi:hypothetical protein OHB26_31115 [Nocardia sp. NBC_01503]|uniref:hypothetical protein n=1 Tax=Nocardia sp. NBC_01503 TaxID=2975997 RepID=UPI002E7C33B1|nr:hypothetical protein [Nocardia sp. NBC_01503]WTL31325.1 hypothetical protein OHB26_31115 [Nocardia sp. NBC_01503]
MKTTAAHRIRRAATIGCVLAALSAGTATAAPLVLQPAAEAPAIADGTGSFDINGSSEGNVWFSVSQGSSEMGLHLFEFLFCNVLGSSSPFICGFQ